MVGSGATVSTFLLLSFAFSPSQGCNVISLRRMSRMFQTQPSVVAPASSPSSSHRQWNTPNEISGSTPIQKSFSTDQNPGLITRINAPGERFTATHGIALREGTQKHFVFVVDRTDAAFLAISSSITTVQDTNGGPDCYEIYLRKDRQPTTKDYDQKSTVTAAESYVGDVLYSRDLFLSRPSPGSYYLLVVAKKDFQELLITAIMDTPPPPPPSGPPK